MAKGKGLAGTYWERGPLANGRTQREEAASDWVGFVPDTMLHVLHTLSPNS